MNRRRFLTLAASFACAPAFAQASSWTGIAMGARVSVTLEGPASVTAPILAEVPEILQKFEAEFSLYQTESTLSRLNAAGRLTGPSAQFQALMGLCDKMYAKTGGLFDPTVQSIWQAAGSGQPAQNARHATGWDRVSHSATGVRLDHGQALTFNGIAQGFATDLISRFLKSKGATTALVNIGEYKAIGGPFTLGLSDPVHGHLGTRQMTNRAIATSSPGVQMVGTEHHILGPQGQSPLWSTLSVEADSAAIADAASTAGCMMTHEELVALKARINLHRVTTVDRDGRLKTI